MKAREHAMIGAAAAVAPDIFLALFGWRQDWLPKQHPLVRAHRFLHSPQGLVAIWLMGWSTHVIIDWFSPHRSYPVQRGP